MVIFNFDNIKYYDNMKEYNMNFININIEDVDYNSISVNKCLDIHYDHKIINNPKYLSIFIKKNKNTLIDISEKISPSEINFFNQKRKWQFQSAICIGENNNIYTILKINNELFSFNINNIPNLKKIDKNSKLINDIMKDVHKILYKLCE